MKCLILGAVQCVCLEEPLGDVVAGRPVDPKIFYIQKGRLYSPLTIELRVVPGFYLFCQRLSMWCPDFVMFVVAA